MFRHESTLLYKHFSNIYRNIDIPARPSRAFDPQAVVCDGGWSARMINYTYFMCGFINNKKCLNKLMMFNTKSNILKFYEVY